MTGSKTLGIAVGLLLAAASPAAFAADAPAPSPASDTTGHSVIAYPASFFANMSLNTAYDMVLRVPGFVFDDGSSLRGFASAVGNVPIDGAHPASKTDDLISILTRIPAGTVERIDLIRGGAPGIDMQGKTVVVNVIRKKAGGFTGALTAGFYKPVGIPIDPTARLEGRWDAGDRVLEASLKFTRGHDGSQTNGPHEIFGPNGQVLDSTEMRNKVPNRQHLTTAAYEAPALGGKLRVNLTL